MKIFLTTVLFMPLFGFGQIVTDGLVGHWSFDGNGNDKTSIGNDGVISGAVFINDRFSENAKAIEFDGIDDYIEIPNSSEIEFDGANDNYTVCFWLKSFRPYKTIENARIVEKGNTGDGYPFSITGNKDSVMEALIWDKTTVTSLIFGDVFDGSWHMVSMIVDNSSGFVFAYVDGVKIDSVANLAAGDAKNNETIKLGNNAWSDRPYQGKLDELLIYNKALSPKEVMKNFNDGVSTVIGTKEFEQMVFYSNDFIRVNFKGRISIYNLSGKEVKTIENYQGQEVFLNEFDQGLYFLRTENGQSFKFLKH